eukprot:1160006-Pelagomonas_calceolata.AAC.15
MLTSFQSFTSIAHPFFLPPCPARQARSLSSTAQALRLHGQHNMPTIPKLKMSPVKTSLLKSTQCHIPPSQLRRQRGWDLESLSSWRITGTRQ